MSFAKMAFAVFVGNLMFALVALFAFSVLSDRNDAKRSLADAQAQHHALAGNNP